MHPVPVHHGESTMDDVDEAERAAMVDWREARAAFRVCGALAADLPQLTASRPLYSVSSGSTVTPEKLRWAEAYTRTLRRLLEEQGIPDWAPWRRVPSRDACLSLLRAGVSDAGSLPMTLGTRRQVLWMVGLRESRGKTSLRFAHEEARDVLIVGGTAGARAGDVDCLDARDGRYMANYQYRRRHVGVFPWE